MAREVRGFEGSLLEAIETGVVPRPGRIGYSDWNAWRAREGRPAKRHGDDDTTSTSEEACLWRQVMEALYGPEWQTDLPPTGSAPPPGGPPEEEELLSISGGEPGEASAELASQALTPVAPQGLRSQASSTVGNESVFQDPSQKRLESALGMAFDPEKESAMKYAKRA